MFEIELRDVDLIEDEFPNRCEVYRSLELQKFVDQEEVTLSILHENEETYSRSDLALSGSTSFRGHLK